MKNNLIKSGKPLSLLSLRLEANATGADLARAYYILCVLKLW